MGKNGSDSDSDDPVDEDKVWRRIHELNEQDYSNSNIDMKNRSRRKSVQAKKTKFFRISEKNESNSDEDSASSDSGSDSGNSSSYYSSSSDGSSSSSSSGSDSNSDSDSNGSVESDISHPFMESNAEHIMDVFDDSHHVGYNDKLAARRKSTVRRDKSSNLKSKVDPGSSIIALSKLALTEIKAITTEVEIVKSSSKSKENNDNDNDGNQSDTDSHPSTKSDYNDDKDWENDELIDYDTGEIRSSSKDKGNGGAHIHSGVGVNDEEKRPSTQDGFDFELLHSSQHEHDQVNNDYQEHDQIDKWTRNGLNLIGVTLDVLKTIQNISSIRRKNMTTRNVVDEIIKPITKAGKYSLIHYIQDKKKIYKKDLGFEIPTKLRSATSVSSKKALYGRASVYISHSWDYVYDEFIDALDAYEHDLRQAEIIHDDAEGNHHGMIDKLTTKKTRYYYWIDIFCSNQWKPIATRLKSPPVYWFEFTLCDFIKNIGSFALIILPWHCPDVLKRTWALAEIVACSLANIQVTVQFSRERHHRFISMIGDNYDKCRQILDNFIISAENSLCTSEYARENILDAFDFIMSQMKGSAKNAAVVANNIDDDIALSKNSTFSANMGSKIDNDIPKTINVLIQKKIFDWLDSEATIIYEKKEKEYKKMVSILHDKQYSMISRIIQKSFFCHAFGCAEIYDFTQDIRNRQVRMLEAMQHLARIYVQLGDVEKGELKYINTLKESISILGNSHGFTLTIMGNLAVAHKKLKKFNESEKMLKLTLARKEKVLGQSHPSTVATLVNLATLLKDTGKLEDSRQILNRVLTIQNDIFGENDDATLNTIEIIASIQLELKFYDGAMKLLKHVLSAKTLIYGKNHPETLIVLETIGEVYFVQNDYINACDVYEKALNLREGNYGKNNPSTLQCYNNLGRIHEKLNDMNKAIYCYERLLGGTIELMGGRHFGTYRVRDKLLYLKHYVKEKRDNNRIIIDGRQLFEDARKDLSMKDPVTLTIAHHYADFLISISKFNDAVKYYRKSYYNRKENLGVDDAYTLISMYGLAYSLAKISQFKESYMLFQELLDRFDRHAQYGPNHPKTIETLISFIELCKISNDKDKSETCMRRLLQYYTETYGPSDEKTMNVIRDINNSINNSSHSGVAYDSNDRNKSMRQNNRNMIGRIAKY